MLRALLASALLSATLSAQIIAPFPQSFTGVVEPAFSPGPPIICAPPTHQLKCSGGVFFLQSDTIDLDDYIGQNVKLVGTAVDKGCPLIEITEVISPPPATLELCGTTAIGCPVRLVSAPGNISQHIIWFSGGPGLFSLSVQKGSLLLAMPFFELVSVAGGFGAEGAAFDFHMPTDSNLIGVDLWLQNARRDVGPIGPLSMGNAICFSILPAHVPCVLPDC
jgi:hypothetical protein